ncbi:AraC family transcriptional regulator [Alkalihalobacillus trypoxylicola]|uniref:AraC family transcriptional regulator n=1 Tax=Alkalihalobacillus trypoxylicola TaxID=519424 RepID=A0A161PAG9_9BACI|nr:AraC family transcriptional regulator [Alkalihalobacillus trypoxylicola]KYG28221.1 AraC family transcriptional regulator [Alkalihalobacillus trypoxylicola]
MNHTFPLLQKELIYLLKQHAQSDGTHNTSIPSLRIIRASTLSEPVHSVFEPSLCLIAQGSKIVMLSEECYRYDSSSYLAASVHLPVSGQIVEALPEKPYLCVQISFSAAQILDIIKDSDHMWASRRESKRGILVNKTNLPLYEAIVRLIRLLETPKDITVLSPLIIREILYRILQDDEGERIIQFALLGSHAQRIAKAIHLIHDDFSKPLRIQKLAKEVSMSVSALHNQFKKVTAMSPLQYQKSIRLQEARRLLFAENKEAADVAFQIGYESPSQFSREYARMFGLPPISDVNKLRSSLS